MGFGGVGPGIFALGDGRTVTRVSLFDLFDHHAQSMSQTQDEKYHLITRRLQEVLGKDAIKALLDQGKNPKCYWGMSTVSIWVVKWLT